ncbi:MAG: hypothetical protein ABIJ18_01535 [archaeon]
MDYAQRLELIKEIEDECFRKKIEYSNLVRNNPSELVSSLNPNYVLLEEPQADEKQVFIVRDRTDDITKVLKIEPWENLNGPVCESVALDRLSSVKGIPKIYDVKLNKEILPFERSPYVCEYIEGTHLVRLEEIDPRVYLRMARMAFDFHKRGFLLPCDWKNNTIVDENGQPWLVDLGHIRYYAKEGDFDFGDIFFDILGEFFRDERSGVPLRK